jgi:hypothetical protein
MRLLLVLLCAGSLHAEFRAGASKAVITPDLKKHGPVYLAGFGNNRAATGIHDDLYARCVAISAGANPLVVCEADLIGLFLDDTDRIRSAVRAKHPTADVVVASTHVHEGPDTMGQWGPSRGVSGINDSYLDFVVERTAHAALEAIRTMRPARASFATVSTPELDSFIDDDRPPVTHDSDLILMSLESSERQPIATIVNWANHPETLGSKNTEITADYPHYLCARLEQRIGGMAVLWNGAVGGMQSPLGSTVKDPETGGNAADGTFRKAEIIGTRVADLAADAVKSAKRAPVDQIVYRESRIQVPMSNPGFQAAAQAGIFKGRKTPNADGSITTPVGLIRLSGGGRPVLEVALVPGELYPELSTGKIERYSGADYPGAPLETAIKPSLAAPYRMLIGLANDEIGYIIPKCEWDEKPPYLNGSPKKFYGEVNSVGPEAAPLITAAFEKLLQ